MPDMLLDVAAFLKSDFAAHPNAEVFRYGIFAWCVAFHEVPAGSLPDDNATIARLTGLGRDPGAANRFAALREQGALHGFVKCSDGRLYHPVVAEKARSAWGSKDKQRAKTAAARAALAAKLAAQKGVAVTAAVTVPATTPVTEPVEVAETGSNRTEPNKTEHKGIEKEPPSLALGAGGEKKTSGDPLPGIPILPPWVPAQAWKGFAEMRKRIRAPLTPEAIRLTITKLEKLRADGQDIAAVLDQSTQSAYRGVFPVNDNGGRNGTANSNRGNGRGAAHSRYLDGIAMYLSAADGPSEGLQGPAGDQIGTGTGG
jgi:hypothetical protein